MSLKYCILATEGAHDQAVLCSLLRLSGLHSFKGDRKSLDTFWLSLLPGSQKPKSGDLNDELEDGNLYAHRRIHIPYFFMSQTHSVAVYQGYGSRLGQNIADIMSTYRAYYEETYAIGLIVDADNHQPDAVARQYADKLRPFFPKISGIPGTITVETPRTGIYVFPDNKEQGTLDTVLVDCASVVYRDHMSGAVQFLDSLDAGYKSHWKPFDREKAIVASIVSVIQPGIASHLSLARAKDRWIGKETLTSVTRIASLNQFIKELLDLPA